MAEGFADREKGTFRETRSGSLEYRSPYYDAYGERRIKSVTADSEEACYERADEFIFKLEQKLIGIDMDATIPDILTAKAENDFQKNYTGEQGYDRNLQTIAIIKRSAIGRMPIAHVNDTHLEDFLQSITRYSNTVIRKIYSMLRVAFRLAYDKRVVKRNYLADRALKCPKSIKPDKKVRGLTEEEQKKYVAALKAHKVPYGRNTYKLQLFIELYSGIRMGEINALEPMHINLKKGFCRAENTVSRGRNGRSFIKKGTKTGAGERDVPISKPLRPILEQALKEMRDNPEGTIFYDHNKGDIITTSQVNSFHQRICEKAGIKVCGQHALRHTFATRCIEAGVPAIVLKKWLGHTNIHITLDTYADVFDRMNFDAITKFEDYMDSVMTNE